MGATGAATEALRVHLELGHLRQPGGRCWGLQLAAEESCADGAAAFTWALCSSLQCEGRPPSSWWLGLLSPRQELWADVLWAVAGQGRWAHGLGSGVWIAWCLGVFFPFPLLFFPLENLKCGISQAERRTCWCFLV